MRNFNNWSNRFGNFRLERLRSRLAVWSGLIRGVTQRSPAPNDGKIAQQPAQPATLEAGSRHAAADCRLQWRPSRTLAAALVALGLLAGFSVLMSELPAALAVPLAAAAGLWAFVGARRELRRPPRRLRIRADRASLDDAPITALSLHWRGWLARLDFTGADGRRERLLWWPDTLDAAARRELRLAVAVSAPARDARSVAP